MDPSGVRDQYAVADVFVLPSFAEGVPIVLMEAMASGVPVISTRITGIPELIESGRDGLLVAAWAEGLSRTTPGKATIPEIPAAARLEIDATLEACEKDLHRLLQLDAFSECPEIHFDLSRLETVSVLSAVRLVHLRKRIEGHLARERSPEDTPHVQLRSPQPPVAHLFEMIGLSPELTSGTPAPAALPDREPLLSEPDEADLVLPS